jgi:hypothetical protein
MSTKSLTTIVATALVLSSLTASAAQARPSAVDLQNGTGTVSSGPSVPTVHGRLGGGHIISSGSFATPVPRAASSQPAQQAGTSVTLVAELAGLVLLGTALLAIWLAARNGRGARPLPH